ncbi:hypothetical protein PAAL109150_06380 [Paenibacillus alkaliterrae]
MIHIGSYLDSMSFNSTYIITHDNEISTLELI